MEFRDLSKLERQYNGWLKQQPFVENSKVDKNSKGEWALWIYYKKGMLPIHKRKIAEEIGGVLMHWHEIK